MEKRLAEIKARAAEILNEMNNENLTDDQLTAMEAEQRSLEEEANMIKRKMDVRGKLVDMKEEKEENPMVESFEERAAEIKRSGRMSIEFDDVKAGAFEQRSTLIASDTILTPTKSADVINDNLNPVSSIIDQVTVIDATGAGSYEEPYVKSESEAGDRTDGLANSTPSDPVFRVAKMAPQLIDVTSYVSKNIEKVSPVAYAEKIKQLALKALRRKVADAIVNGNGSFFGIKTAKNTKNEDICKTLTVTSTTIGAGTLNDIVFSYGGSDELAGNARLYLTKEDLKAFGDVRGTNEKKNLYEIIPDAQNPNIGTIKQGGLIVPYTIMSGLTSLSKATAGSAPIQTMLYGAPTNYEVALFGNYEVEVSKDYKFAEGLLTIMGEVMAGGNVIVDGGFVVVTLAATE
ncbi:MAG: phage major capsid protein [Bacilli bacterium]|nr:phage major capsid protein [Bacilli bacterium]